MHMLGSLFQELARRGVSTLMVEQLGNGTVVASWRSTTSALCTMPSVWSAGGEPVHRRHVGGWFPGEDGLAVVHGAEHVRLALNSFLVS